MRVVLVLVVSLYALVEVVPQWCVSRDGSIALLPWYFPHQELECAGDRRELFFWIVTVPACFSVVNPFY